MNKNNQKLKAAVYTITQIFRKVFYFEPHLLAVPHEKKYAWQKVLCLVGLDYFSTLAYQPALALLFVGLLAPFASLMLVIVTLFGAVPTYFAVASRSYTGQGSIAMLEKLVSGWLGKFILLGLIAFAATDFIITITLSASDAAEHIVKNPTMLAIFRHSHFFGNFSVSLFLVGLLGFVFFIGIREAITLSVLLTVPFLILTFIVIFRCLYEISLHPNLFFNWIHNPVFHVSNISFFIVIMIAFPKLALGLSGLETGVSTMPLIKSKNPKQIPPQSLIMNTQKMLLASGLIMSFCLITSSLIACIFITQAQVSEGGIASGRALSYLSHKFLGTDFGNVYDIFTILILWFAGGSAMAGLLAIIPRYLPRFGMAPKWVGLRKPLVVLITGISAVIVILFRADVTAQSGAYATGVLALILSATIAVTIAFKREWVSSRKPILRVKYFYFFGVSCVFIYTFLDNIYARPDGLIIASLFFIFILLGSFISRWIRASELRVENISFVDAKSEEIFNSIKNKKVNLVPVAQTKLKSLIQKEEKIKTYYKVDRPLAFLAIKLRDDRSEFITPLEISVETLHISNRVDYLIQVSGAVAISNTVAYISEQLKPNAIFLELTRKNTMQQELSYVLFGEGEIGILTYKVLVQYWEKSKEANQLKPIILLISE